MSKIRKLNTPEKRARVGERIKIAATQAGITLKELSESAGTSPSLIYQYVRGITAVPDDLLEKIATVTRVHTDFFDPGKDARSSLALPADTTDPSGEFESSASEPGTRARMRAELRHLHEMAEALNYPKRNRSAYISSLDQMLSLARTLEDRPQEAWILWKLGCAKLEDNDLEQAKKFLIQSKESFAIEGLDEYKFHVTQDLVVVLSEQGAFVAAKEYLEDLISNGGADILWRTLISMGSLCYRQHDFEDALKYYIQAAEQMEGFDSDKLTEEGMPPLMNHIADIVRSTGHYEEAMFLWSYCLQQAAKDRKADAFLESLMEVAQCCLEMGRLHDAKEHLEKAVMLASFLFEDESRLSIARALLAIVLISMGSIEEAKDNARASFRIANKVQGARPTILSCIALAETNIAVGNWDDALANAEEALKEAKRTSRTREVAQAREIKSRAFILQYQQKISAGDEAAGFKALHDAIDEGKISLETAIRAESVKEQVAAHLILSRAYLVSGDFAASENEARQALAITNEGAVGLNRLLGADSDRLPSLLKSSLLNLPDIFARQNVYLPILEWQAHYLQSTLLAKRIGPEAAYVAVHSAAESLSKMFNGLTSTEVAALQKCHPDISKVFQDLTTYSINEADRHQTKLLMQSVPWAAQPTAIPAIAPSR